MRALVLPVVVLVAVLLSPAGCELYYVRGSSSSPDATPCPPEASPCLTLQEYVDSSTEFLPENMSDVEFRFLSGEHSLSKPFVVEGGRNISLRSANVRSVWDGLDVTVICSNYANFEFIRTILLSIHGVAFLNCGGGASGALSLDTVADYIMQDVEIANSLSSHVAGYSLYGNFSVSQCLIGGLGLPYNSMFHVGVAASTFRIDFNSIFIASPNSETNVIAFRGSYNFYNDIPVTLRNVTVIGSFMYAVGMVNFRAPFIVEKCNFSVTNFVSGISLVFDVSGPTSIVDSMFSGTPLLCKFLPAGEQMQTSTDTAPGASLQVSNCTFTGNYRYSEGRE